MTRTRFTGRHERTLDPKGRLALPADYRRQFESQCFLTFGQNRCIEVFTPEGFDAMADDLLEKERRGEKTRADVRALSHNTFTVNVDAQGRINVDKELRDFAQIELSSKVVVAGAIDRMEIWNAAAHEAAQARGVAGLAGDDD